MKTFTTVSELREALSTVERADIGFVPTMGALHAGHRSLVEKARKECKVVVVSVFVNPTQFNDKNDLRNYPRTPEADAALLEAAGADFVLMPSVEEIYPEPDTRIFDFGQVDKVMEGATRPGHFNGVAQVVSRLFDMVQPAKAYFGEKDFQQIAVIRRMAMTEGIDINIVSCPIKREDDGLAMSSRNVRLTESQRATAPGIYAALKYSLEYSQAHSVAATHDTVVERINALPECEVEYFSIVDGITLQPIEEWTDSEYIVGCITVYCGDVRLIDNITYRK